MSTFPPTTTVFNDGYIAETYERYRRDPSSVDESWRQFFRTAESLAGITGSGGGVADAALLRKTAGGGGPPRAVWAYGTTPRQRAPPSPQPPRRGRGAP